MIGRLLKACGFTERPITPASEHAVEQAPDNGSFTYSVLPENVTVRLEMPISLDGFPILHIQMKEPSMTPLEKLYSLTPTERFAFLALFSGARSRWQTRSDTDEMPFTGKDECQWVTPWRPFWQEKLPGLGFITFTESEPRPAPGAIFDSYTEIWIRVTDEGRAAREAYWTQPRGDEA